MWQFWTILFLLFTIQCTQIYALDTFADTSVSLSHFFLLSTRSILTGALGWVATTWWFTAVSIVNQRGKYWFKLKHQNVGQFYLMNIIWRNSQIDPVPAMRTLVEILLLERGWLWQRLAGRNSRENEMRAFRRRFSAVFFVPVRFCSFKPWGLAWAGAMRSWIIIRSIKASRLEPTIDAFYLHCRLDFMMVVFLNKKISTQRRWKTNICDLHSVQFLSYPKIVPKRDHLIILRKIRTITSNRIFAYVSSSHNTMMWML